MGDHSTGEDLHKTQKKRCALDIPASRLLWTYFSITQLTKYTGRASVVKPPDAHPSSLHLFSLSKHS